MTKPLAPAAVPPRRPPSHPEILQPLPIGTIVRCPDGTVGEVVSCDHGTARVLHRYLQIAGIAGAGPWQLARYEVEPAAASERRAYYLSCTAASITDSEIYQLQDLAIRTGDQAMRYRTYAALGVDARVAYGPVSESEQLRARAQLANDLEMIRATGGFHVGHSAVRS